MKARSLTIKGPPGSVDRSQGVAAATLVRSFQRMVGFLGGVVLVDTDGSCVRTIGFWEDDVAVTSSNGKADIMGRNLAISMFGPKGTYEIQTFEVIGLDPPPVVGFPELLKGD